jgi:DNA polymerase III subunit delta
MVGMKINANLIENFLQKIPSGLKVFLLYGPDEGRIRITLDRLIKHYKKAGDVAVERLDFKDVRNDIRILSDELNSISLFNDTKLVIVENCVATLNKDFINLIANLRNGSELILVAGDLKPTSNLRKTCETLDVCAVIACYKDDPYQMQQYIREYLSSQKFSFDKDVPYLISEILPSNRMLVAGELEKLITYAFDNASITKDDVIDVISESSEITLDELCVAFITKNRLLIQENIARATSDNTSFMLLIRVLQKYVVRLIEILNHKETGLSTEQAVSKLVPPVFFKQKDNVVRCADSISKSRAFNLLDSLLQLEISCKSSSFSPEILLYNYLTLCI